MAAESLCKIDGCDKPASAKEFCSGHYHRQARYGDPLYAPPRKNGGKCAVDACVRKARSKGWCKNHYWRFRSHGDPVAGRISPGTTENWLFEHIGYDGRECLIWPFSRGEGGYGYASLGGLDVQAHRAMCELAHGPAPSLEHETAHNCGKGHEGCVHPKHIRWDTPKGNQGDRLIHDTHCRGERSGTAKLTSDDVTVIRRIDGAAPRRVLAARFGVSVSTINSVVWRKSWAWLN